jgi:hypothetical protein
MIRDFFLTLVSMFIVQPFETELNKKLASVQAPQAVIQQVRACATTAGPALATRATGDIWWATTTIIGVAVGLTNPQTVIAEAGPECASAIAAVGPILNSTRV